MQIFLDYCALNDALRDAPVLAKLRSLRRNHQLVTSTTVVGEALALLMEGEKEGQYMLVDLVRDLRLEVLQPKKGWQVVMARLNDLLRGGGANFVSSAELAHMSLAVMWSVDLYITSRPQARNLSRVPGLDRMLRVVDLEQARELVAKPQDNSYNIPLPSSTTCSTDVPPRRWRPSNGTTPPRSPCPNCGGRWS